jgi:hypothetical protein
VFGRLLALLAPRRTSNLKFDPQRRVQRSSALCLLQRSLLLGSVELPTRASLVC